jgi:hypothetical protein
MAPKIVTGREKPRGNYSFYDRNEKRNLTKWEDRTRLSDLADCYTVFLCMLYK